MSLIITLLYIVFVMAAIVLVVVILLQEGKGGGFGDALGAAGQQAFGVKASGVQKFTAYIAIIFLAAAVFIHVLNNKRAGSSSLSGESNSLSETDGALEAPAERALELPFELR